MTTTNTQDQETSSKSNYVQWAMFDVNKRDAEEEALSKRAMSNNKPDKGMC
jgi:hypothetical protein